MEGASLSDANLTNSYFSSSFIGVNGFGSPAESKYSMMQVKAIDMQYDKCKYEKVKLVFGTRYFFLYF